jgi:hypothetical protein
MNMLLEEKMLTYIRPTYVCKSIIKIKVNCFQGIYIFNRFFAKIQLSLPANPNQLVNPKWPYNVSEGFKAQVFYW